mmetsp:Transcript_7077/g.13039  ORF Transcript_7077/g.13039 Transcript_7077/m.13039 type:complete len:129 (-) Transcript_7077:128-514(-)
MDRDVSQMVLRFLNPNTSASSEPIQNPTINNRRPATGSAKNPIKHPMPVPTRVIQLPTKRIAAVTTDAQMKKKLPIRHSNTKKQPAPHPAVRTVHAIAICIRKGSSRIFSQDHDTYSRAFVAFFPKTS